MATPILDDDFPGVQAVITAPQPGVGLGGQVTITGSAAADPAAFDYYLLEYGAGPAPRDWVAIGGDITSPVRSGILGVWDTNPLPEGIYTLRLTVIGRTGAMRRYTVPVDVERSTPVIHLSAPPDGSILNAGDVVQVAADAQGPQGLAGVEFYVDDVRAAVVYTAPYQFDWTATLGTHVLGAVAYSPTGRAANSASVHVQVREAPTPTATPPPEFYIASPDDQATIGGGTLPIVVTAGPNVPVTRVDLYVDGWLVTHVGGQGTFQLQWQVVPGRHTILVIGYDQGGQEVARAQAVVYNPP